MERGAIVLASIVHEVTKELRHNLATKQQQMLGPTPLQKANRKTKLVQ